MKFKVGDSGQEIEKSISYQSFPDELYKEGIWGHFAFIHNKEHDQRCLELNWCKKGNGIRVICSAYNTDRYKPGTVVVSNKIFNEFPIAQSAWTLDNQISRMYVDPFYRSKKVATYSVITNDMLAKKLGYEIWSSIYSKNGGTIAGDQLYNHIYSLGFENKKVEIDLNDMFQYRNFSHPVNYIDKRTVYVEPDV